MYWLISSALQKGVELTLKATSNVYQNKADSNCFCPKCGKIAETYLRPQKGEKLYCKKGHSWKYKGFSSKHH